LFLSGLKALESALEFLIERFLKSLERGIGSSAKAQKEKEKPTQRTTPD
jgi:hypothetical protein